MTRVKVCGITRRDDALRAAELGADALGFVFATRSPRRAEPDVVTRIITELPPFVTTVGVFQDQPIRDVQTVMDGCGLHLAQLHGREDAKYIRTLERRVLMAVSLARREDLRRLQEYPDQGSFLLDTGSGERAGGTGKTFDWDWAVDAKRFGRIVLAGGLHSGNVAEAIRRVRPWAVDAASGTEASPGIKDPEKVKAFVQNARRADSSLERHRRIQHRELIAQ